MTAGAQQPISAIAAGDSAVTHQAHSTTEGDRRCENAAALCNEQNQVVVLESLVDFIIKIVMPDEI